MVSQGVSMLWSSFIGKKKVSGADSLLLSLLSFDTDTHYLSQSEERLPMKFSALVQHVSKKPVPAHVTHFVVEVMASDKDGEDVEVRICNCFSRYLFPIPIVLQVPFIVVRK